MIQEAAYRDKVLGCWLGKNIGGTVGAPFEWMRQVNNITFYTQDLRGEAMPNDDLDIQLLWLCAMEEKGLTVDAKLLAEYWCLYVTPHWAEYGIAKTNLRSGLQPPLSGSHLNNYRHSCGSYIRSEIWACIAPGQPELAARYAYEDASIDHGNGEGIYAEVFMAALESAAFLVSDLRELIKIGLSYIPVDCGVTKAIATTLACFDAGKSWKETREEVLIHHRGTLANWMAVSEEDAAKGFRTSEHGLGYDVPSNIAFTLAGLLYGGEDFGAVQCICVNIGEDTDCTAATAGSVWGIIHGATQIPQKWIDPIGRNIKTVCLNLGELGYFGNQLPANVDNLTERTVKLARRLWQKQQPDIEWLNYPALTKTDKITTATFTRTDQGAFLYGCMNGPRFQFDFFAVECAYPDGPAIRQGQPARIRFTIINQYKTQANLSLHWYLPEDWQVGPAADGWALCHNGGRVVVEYQFTADRITRATNRAVLEITCEGRPTVMLVPILLLSSVEATPGQL